MYKGLGLSIQSSQRVPANDINNIKFGFLWLVLYNQLTILLIYFILVKNIRYK